MNVDGGGFEFAGMRLVNISFAFEGDGIGGGNPPDYFASAATGLFRVFVLRPRRKPNGLGLPNGKSVGRADKFHSGFFNGGRGLGFCGHFVHIEIFVRN